MAYERLNLVTGDQLSEDVFKHLEDGIEALDLALDSKVVEVEKTHRSTNRFNADVIPYIPSFYVGNNIDSTGKFEYRTNVGTCGAGGWTNIPVEPGKTYTMSIPTLTLTDLSDMVYGNFENIFFTDSYNKVITTVTFNNTNFWIKVTSGTDTSILNEVNYDTNKIVARAYGSNSNTYKGLQTNAMQIEIIDENIAYMHIQVGCNKFWKYQIESTSDFINRGGLTSDEISQLQNGFQINEGTSLLAYEKGGDYTYTEMETQSNLTKLQSAFSLKEIPSTNLLQPIYAKNKQYTVSNYIEKGKPYISPTHNEAILIIPVSVGEYTLHSKSETTIEDRTFGYFGKVYFTDADGGYITGNYGFTSSTGFNVGVDTTKAEVSGELTSTLKFTVLDESIKYIIVPLADDTKNVFGLWKTDPDKYGISDDELHDLVYNMQLNSGKKILDYQPWDYVEYRSMILPKYIDGLDVFQQNMEEKIDESLANASSKDNNMVVIIEDSNIYVKAKKYSDDTHFIWKNVKSRGDNYDSNRFFNIDTAYTCSARCLDEDVTSMTTWKYCNDDICPVNFNGTYIGANHGYNCLNRITATSHGKTESDIGSIWTCNSTKYVLVRIYDANNLDMVMFNDTNMSTGVMGYGNPVGTMTHTSGATNISDIVIESNNNTQLRRGINHYNINLYVDDKQRDLNTNGVILGNRVDLRTEYDVIYVPAMLNYLIDNVGNNTNESLYSEEINDSYLTMYIDYQFNMNGSVSTYSSFYINKNITLGYFGLVQSGAISDTSYMYIPNTSYNTPILQGSMTYKFTPDTWISSSEAPYRYYQFEDSSITKGIAMIYDRSIGMGDNTKRLSQLSSAGQFYNTQKMYPALINGGSLTAGTFIDGMAARVPLYKYDPDVTSVGWYWSNEDIHLMIDTHNTVNKDIVLPDYMNKMRIEILDKTDSVICDQTYIFNNKLRFICDEDYGYIVLRLYK